MTFIASLGGLRIDRRMGPTHDQQKSGRNSVPRFESAVLGAKDIRTLRLWPQTRSRRLSRAAALTALAATSAALAGGWGPPVTITGYYVWDNSFAALNTSNNQNPDGCTSSHYLILDVNQMNFKALWAEVIAAQAQGQTVSLSYNGCSGPYPLINSIAVPNVW